MDSAANDLLENGIYVETNRGLVCMSLKDALTSGVGGLKLSVEDLQNIAQLLTQTQQDADASTSIKFEESGPTRVLLRLQAPFPSRLSLQEKQKYIDQAEEDKKRYRRELKTYRQSSAYQEFLRNKRHKRVHQGSRTEESDMDATDEIEEDEDNEELYCRRCDQWFSSLHNKKEHLYGRTHMQAIANDPQRRELSTPISTSLDESSLDGCPPAVPSSSRSTASKSRPAPSREKEIRFLDARFHALQARNAQLVRDLSVLREREVQLRHQRTIEGNEGRKINKDLQDLAGICYALSPQTDPLS
ncbi:hypothetical protein B566_EDAN012277 [Ephemera danica]|nr:hypothetical protein B566_EDAN012277 [Ephemera danica]